MGGFTLNGCGASDSYYPIKYLGDFNCSCCGKTQRFSLMELRMKIRVFFVPTVTVNTKYAIVCEKCKTGYYVDERTKNNILSGKIRPVVTDEGVEFIELEQKIVNKSFTEDMTPKESPNDIIVSVVKTEQNDIPQIEALSSEKVNNLNDTDSFKTTSSSKLTVDSQTEVSFTNRVVKICPSCQMLYSSSKEKCTVCGKDLEIRR